MPKKAKAILSWREFYAKQTKGKKFGSREAVNAHMKKLSAEYKALKAKLPYIKMNGGTGRFLDPVSFNLI